MRPATDYLALAMREDDGRYGWGTTATLAIELAVADAIADRDKYYQLLMKALRNSTPPTPTNHEPPNRLLHE